MQRSPREEEAWNEIGHTDFQPGTRLFLFVFFIGLIAVVPLVQVLLPVAPSRAHAVEGQGTWASGRVTAVSAPPQGDAVYQDFVMTLRVEDVEPAGDAAAIEVLVLAMRERRILPAASLRPGDRIRFQPRPWNEVAAEMGSLKTADLPDADLTENPVRVWADSLEAASANPASPLDFLKAWDGTGAELAQAWSASGGGWGRSFLAANRALGRRISAYEDALDDGAWLTRLLKSPVQALMLRLGVGNDKAYVGRDGWLFYEPGVKALSGPGFLGEKQLRRRARAGGGFAVAVQPDPFPAILRFRDDLAARGIELILLPVPVKPSIHPEKFTASLADLEMPLRNRSFDDWLARMEREGVRVLDPGPLLKARARREGPQYLATDTHWTPDAMRAVAEWVGQELGGTATAAPFAEARVPVTHLGDIGAMLGLPERQGAALAESAVLRRILLPDGSPWRADPAASLLLLGDSFANIYSVEAMGWGSSAGFAEQLSQVLGASVDRLSRNDAGAYATRERLVAELAADPRRLDGKKTVLWQFAERELSVGDWKVLPLPEAVAPPTVGPAPVASPLQALGAMAGDAPALAGKDAWLFLGAELRHLGAGPFWGESAAKASQATKDPDALAALLDLHRKLAELDIGLILLPVPPRAVVYADKLLDGLPLDEHGVPRRIDIHHQAFYELLRQEGVRVVDLTDAFLAARRDDEQLGPVCLPQDSHWSPRGIGLAVEALAAEVRGQDWLAEAPRVETHLLAEQVLRVKGDLAERVPGHETDLIDLRFRAVSASPEAFVRVPNAPESPLLVLSDSHSLVFHLGGDMLCEGAGLSDQLTHALGMPVDLMGMRGSGSSVRRELARRFLTKPAEAAQKKVVIYCFAARAFTESENWTPVPLRR